VLKTVGVVRDCATRKAVRDSSSEGTGDSNARESEGTDVIVTHVSRSIADSLDRFLASRSVGSVGTRIVDLPKFAGK
jgi:hypothetical protein